MQIAALFIVAVVLVWVILTFGIEPALLLATVISGVVWLVDWQFFRRKRQAGEKEPLTAEYGRSFFPIFLVVLLLRSFLFEPFRIPSGSMMPTLLVGDFILVNKFIYGIRLPVVKTKIVDNELPKRGDVVVFRWPKDPKMDYIKRVIGVPGDKIRYRNKTLELNGKPIPIEMIGPYLAIGSGVRANGTIEGEEELGKVQHDVLINPLMPDFGPGCDFLGRGEITVPKDRYFVMGDNRDDSNDGRCWGFVPEANLVGKAFAIWLSWDWQRPGFVAWDRIGKQIH